MPLRSAFERPARQGRTCARGALVALLVCALPRPVRSAETAEAVQLADTESTVAAGTSDPAAPLQVGLEESALVTSSRLVRPGTRVTGAVREPADDPAVAPGATLPLLLAARPGVVAADETGNGRQLALELRGFGAGAGATTLLVDGLRFNEPDTNLASFELLPLEELASFDVVAGPAGAVAGGGSLAGVVRVALRRPPEQFEARARVAAGGFGLREAAASVGGPTGPARWLASISLGEGDGFRRDAGWREESARLAGSLDTSSLRLDVSWSHLDGHWRHPGALTQAEWRADPADSGSNALDFADVGHDLVSFALTPRLEAPRRTQWCVTAGWRDRRSELFSTGRSHYGFLTRDRTQGWQVVAEAVTTLVPAATHGVRLRYGLEAALDRLAPRGFATGLLTDGTPPEFTPFSNVRVGWTRVAAFAGLAVDLTRSVRLDIGLRHDAARVARNGTELSFASGLEERVADARSFHDTTASLAVSGAHALGPRDVAATWRASLGQSFLAPSALQLFAFPGFGSNPGLRSQRALGGVLSFGVESARLSAGLDVFGTRVSDEIGYDAGDRRNVNVGRTGRHGVELRLRATPVAWAAFTLGHVVTRASFEDGFEAWDGVVAAGADVPLVPRSSTAAGVLLGPFHGLSLRLDWRRVGPEALSGDFDGSAPRLPAWQVASFGVEHELRAGDTTLRLRVGVTNLLDAQHATRGIETPPEAGVHDGLFYTPASPRSVVFGLEARF